MVARVLVVDDSPMVRRVLTDILDRHPRIEVVATAGDAYEARDVIVELRPDVITLDVEMPRMTGLEFLKRLMVHMPTPVVMVSALTQRAAPTTLAALEAGAVDFVGKPRSSHGVGLDELVDELQQKVLVASRATVRARTTREAATARTRIPPMLRSDAERERHVIAIGSSTGGPDALMQVVTQLPAACPPVVMVQHMPGQFTPSFAQRMDRVSQLRVVEAADGMRLEPGTAYLAPGGLQLRVVQTGTGALLRVAPGEKVSGHAPSVDVMMRSVAAAFGPRAVGAVLTGMGADGAEGLLAMRRAGAHTLAQDEESCVVYGMPRACVANGAAVASVPPSAMPGRFARALGGATTAGRA